MKRGKKYFAILLSGLMIVSNCQILYADEENSPIEETTSDENSDNPNESDEPIEEVIEDENDIETENIVNTQDLEESFYLYTENSRGEKMNAYYDAESDKYYLFMMSSDSKEITLHYVNNEKQLMSKDVSFNQSNTYTLDNTLNGTITVEYMQSNIPSLYISLNGVTLDQIKKDKNIKYAGNSVAVDDPNGSYSMSVNNVEMKGRGNTSWTMYDKKGYQIKFDKKTSLLGMNKAKKWCLLANSSDDSLLKNYLAFQLAQDLDSKYAIHSQFVDLWVDGDYQGNYLVTEKAEIDKNRVNLQDENGILAEWDDVFYKQEEYWFENKSLNAKFAVKETVNEDPEHIQNAMSLFNDALTNFYNYISSTKKSDITIDKLSQYIDVDSFVQYYLINEYMLNKESVTTSFFWYKDGENDVLHLGPVWDFDSCMNYYGNSNEVYIYQRNVFHSLLSIPAFKAYINTYYNTHKSSFDNLSSLASKEAKIISDSANMNYIRWDTLGKSNGKGGYINHTTFSEAVNATSNWLSERSNKFSIPKVDGFDFILNKNKDKMTIRYYPTNAYQNIRFAIWSNDSNQSDLKWFNAKKESNGSVFVAEVNLTSFKNVGAFTMHIYEGSHSLTATSFYVDSLSGGMFRLYNPNSGEHFYTADANEKNHLVSLGWNSEGIGWIAPTKSEYPVYRLYNCYGGEHHYTMNKAEKDHLVKLGWNYEGIGWYSVDPNDKNSIPLLREYNPNAFANNHNYTTDKNEHKWLVSLGWKDEGKAWYALQ